MKGLEPKLVFWLTPGNPVSHIREVGKVLCVSRAAGSCARRIK